MKRLLALLLTICMVASFGSSYAAAEETEPDTKTEATNTEPTIDEKDSNINLEPTDGIINTNATASSLIYSTLYYWDPATMRQYNCYAYVLGKKDYFYYPGYFSNQTYNGLTDDLNKLVQLVWDDLHQDLGYNCVKKQTKRPNTDTPGANTIAVRQDTSYDNRGSKDYHFAKLIKGRWHHKPSDGAILIFKSYPDNKVPWTNECYDGKYCSYTIDYESDIVYFIYKENHGSTTYTWTKNHYHANGYHYFQYGYKCDDCGTYTKKVWTKKACSGPPCNLPSAIVQPPETI